ncbi:hypothetical protein [Streptomyces sp. NPDC059063]|uniref:hypothetical protein n=1 Tax=Streptomyces sp. NPDC059063 TaxID=3346712 RepID=UPI0036B7183B
MNNDPDPAAWSRAYMALGWPVALGHRRRPRQGCTCGDPRCEQPGAHPVDGGPEYLTPEQMTQALQTSPGGSLIVGTRQFDAVTVERYAGMYVMVHLELSRHVPCLLTHETATFLVHPGTGSSARVHPAVDLKTGPDAWVALPPSYGTYWDNPPWDERSATPRDLVHGEQIGSLLEGLRGYLDDTRRVGAVR